MLEERKELVGLIREAMHSGARLMVACNEAGLCERTYRRWYRDGQIYSDQRKDALRPAPTHGLTPEEKQAIIEVCNNERFESSPPTQIVPTLLDEGRYIASEASFYRVLEEAGQKQHRGRAQCRKKRSKPDEKVADRPRVCWSWDISYMPTHTKGLFFYLYLFMDVYSRKIVGYEVYERECGELAKEVFGRCMVSEGNPCGLTLHSDNGAPMKSLTLRAKLNELNVTTSYSRPRVSNDNPFSESLFRTVKYCPSWPEQGFASLDKARDWTQRFVAWYNNEHKHSELRFVTPAQRHNEIDQDVLDGRKVVVEQAKAANPKRWSGQIRNLQAVGPTVLNPGAMLVCADAFFEAI